MPLIKTELTHTHIHTRIHIHVLYNVRHMCQARQRHHQHRRLAARTPILQLSAANSSITGGPGYQQQRERGRERGAYPSLPHPPTCSTIPKEKRVFISLPIVRKPNHNHKSNSYAALQSALKPKSESESETQSQLCSSPPPPPSDTTGHFISFENHSMIVIVGVTNCWSFIFLSCFHHFVLTIPFAFPWKP